MDEKASRIIAKLIVALIIAVLVILILAILLGATLEGLYWLAEEYGLLSSLTACVFW